LEEKGQSLICHVWAVATGYCDFLDPYLNRTFVVDMGPVGRSASALRHGTVLVTSAVSSYQVSLWTRRLLGPAAISPLLSLMLPDLLLALLLDLSLALPDLLLALLLDLPLTLLLELLLTIELLLAPALGFRLAWLLPGWQTGGWPLCRRLPRQRLCRVRWLDLLLLAELIGPGGLRSAVKTQNT
jgi:hypothetical protein